MIYVMYCLRPVQCRRTCLCECLAVMSCLRVGCPSPLSLSSLLYRPPMCRHSILTGSIILVCAHVKRRVLRPGKRVCGVGRNAGGVSGAFLGKKS